jgi:hypothetical protein
MEARISETRPRNTPHVKPTITTRTLLAPALFAAALTAAPLHASAPGDTTPTARPVARRSGESPELARRMGWPVEGPRALPGALLPGRRIVCYYGNPASRRMGALGQYPKAEMLQRLQREVGRWNAADPAHPVKPCLHLVASVAQADAGPSGHYRAIVRDSTVRMVHQWAREVNGILFVDLQIGTDNIRTLLPRFEWILRNPDVHLGLDPEFYMKGGQRPGTRVGTMSAADVNYAAGFLADLVRKHNLPPKVLVVHRFTRRMLTDAPSIRLRPEVQFVIHMDGWGPPFLKRDSYEAFVVRDPVQYAGLQALLPQRHQAGPPPDDPARHPRLEPKPLYIQYQ